MTGEDSPSVPIVPVDPIAPFKDVVERDRAGVFLGLTEFGEVVDVDGKAVMAVVDERERGDRDLEMGLPSDGLRLFAKTEDMPRRRRPGETLLVDHAAYIVESWAEDMGVSEISLIKAQ